MSDHAEYSARRHFVNLDGVRALSILAVLWHHFAQPIPSLPITSRGFLGVDMFFTLSGFLIVTLLLRERDRGGVSLKNFYIRRTLRIFPLYYLVVLLFGALCLVRNAGAFELEVFWGALPWLVTYTSNWTTAELSLMDVSWSLATEEQFYLVWPSLIALASERRARLVLGLAVMVNLAIAFFYTSPSLSILQATFTPILLGVALAHVLHDPSLYPRAAQALGGRWAPAISAGVLLLLLCIPNTDISGFHRTLVHVAMVSLLAGVVVNESAPGTGALRWRFMRRTGEISYGLYLWHLFALAVAYRIVDHAVLTGLIATVLSYAVAEGSFRYFEKPFLRLKSRFATSH